MVERHYPFKSIRDWYKRQEAKIPKLDAQWKAQGLSVKERARREFQIRHNARRQARNMMRNSHEVRKLQARDLRKYGRPDGPTLRQLVQEEKKRGEKGNKIYENIIGSSQRTDRNRSPGFLSKKDILKNLKDRARVRMYNRASLPKDFNWKSQAEVKDFPANNRRPRERQAGRPAESHSSKKQGTTEKMASLRNQSRDRHQSRSKALNTTGEKRVSQTNTKSEEIKSRYGRASDASRARGSANQESKIRGASESRQPKNSTTTQGESKPRTNSDSKPKPSSDNKPRGGDSPRRL